MSDAELSERTTSIEIARAQLFEVDSDRKKRIDDTIDYFGAGLLGRDPREVSMVSVLEARGPHGIFAVLLLACLGVPIPEEMPIIASAVLSHRSCPAIWCSTGSAGTGVRTSSDHEPAEGRSPFYALESSTGIQGALAGLERDLKVSTPRYQIMPKCRKASSIASRFSGGHGSRSRL
jgi:hypothetical protein